MVNRHLSLEWTQWCCVVCHRERRTVHWVTTLDKPCDHNAPEGAVKLWKLKPDAEQRALDDVHRDE